MAKKRLWMSWLGAMLGMALAVQPAAAASLIPEVDAPSLGTVAERPAASGLPCSVTSEQAIALVREQGSEKQYYYPGLSFQEVQLDSDKPNELFVWIIGGSTVGNFFIFDKDAQGRYRKVYEQPWRIDRFQVPLEWTFDGKHLFEVVVTTGGTGVRTKTSYLLYLQDGKVTEAWHGVLLNSQVTPPNTVVDQVGSFVVDEEDQLFIYQQVRLIADRTGKTILSAHRPTVTVYRWNGQRFEQAQEFTRFGP